MDIFKLLNDFMANTSKSLSKMFIFDNPSAKNVKIYKTTFESDDSEKIANDWKKIGTDMRKAILKYDAKLAKQH